MITNLSEINIKSPRRARWGSVL